ncbi:aminotransferase class V-fold PLP-dependent enzyme [Bradyrhizobium elkanii]
MLLDLASRDGEFKEVTARMRRLMLNLLGGAKDYSVVPIQGGGSFAMEAALSSFVSRNDKPLVCINGIYGERIFKILRLWGVEALKLVKRATEPLDPQEVAEQLSRNPGVTHLCLVHCETTTGIVNPLDAIIEEARRRGVKTIVDGMSSFGAIDIDLSRGGPDVLVTSSNKCIEGPPGVAFVIASRELLEKAVQEPRSFVLDVRDQWLSLERTGEWRSTPPTHIVQATTKALEILEGEGIDARRRRYEKVRDDLVQELEGVVSPLLSAELQSPVCVAFQRAVRNRGSGRLRWAISSLGGPQSLYLLEAASCDAEFSGRLHWRDPAQLDRAVGVRLSYIFSVRPGFIHGDAVNPPGLRAWGRDVIVLRKGLAAAVLCRNCCSARRLPTRSGDESCRSADLSEHGLRT